MNRIRRADVTGWLGLIAVLMLGVATAASAATLEHIKQQGYITIAVANENPYGYMTRKGEAEGLGPDTAKQVLKRMGITHIQWVVEPFDSLIPSLQKGQVDMVAASQAVRPERCTKVDFSIPNTTYHEGLLVKSGNPRQIRSYRDFVAHHNLKLGIVSGADQLQFAHQMGIPDSQIVMLKASRDATEALTSGRIDAYAGTQFTVLGLAKKNNAVQPVRPYPPKPFPASPYKDPIIGGKRLRSWGAFTFNKNDDSLRKAFDKNLREFQRTTAWKDILKHYGLDNASIVAVTRRSTQQLCSTAG